MQLTNTGNSYTREKDHNHDDKADTPAEILFSTFSLLLIMYTLIVCKKQMKSN